MNDALKRCLEDLEQRIEPNEEVRLFAEWSAFAEGRFTGDVFSPRRSRNVPPEARWPAVSVNQALRDFDAMALQQMKTCSDELASGGGKLLCVRCNYGTTIIPGLFGVRLHEMPEEMNTLPASWPLPDRNALRRAIDSGVPDLTGGFGGRVLEMGERFQALLRNYPRLARHVHIYHPDLQSPMDICEMLWGSSLFIALIEEPEFVKALLDVLADTYIAFMRAWTRVVPFADSLNVHWGMLHRGAIMLRDDSAMNLSPDMYAEFVRPRDQRLLREFGGGAAHFCGRGDHYIRLMTQMEGLHAVNLSQPELNDMEAVFSATLDRGIPILDLPGTATAAALASGRSFHGRVHCSWAS